jgi:hypothetical protein
VPLVITGSGFSDVAALACVLHAGGAIVARAPAAFLNATAVRCMAPSFPLGTAASGGGVVAPAPPPGAIFAARLTVVAAAGADAPEGAGSRGPGADIL